MTEMTVTGFAYKYSISRQTVYNRMKEGFLEWREIGNRSKIIIDKDYNRSDLLKRQDLQKLMKE